MNIDEFFTTPVLRRVRYYIKGTIGGTLGMSSEYRAGWVFRQKPSPSHKMPESWGFEVETLRHPKEGVLDLKAAGCPTFKYEVLWERPAQPGEGEGPEMDLHWPADISRSVTHFKGGAKQ